jgi:DNA-binding response OmpR family regulator
MTFLEQAMSLLSEEFDLDPLAYLKSRPLPQAATVSPDRLVIDPSMLSVTFGGKSCFLGSTLPFKLLFRLAKKPNSYVTYEDLLDDVWTYRVSDGAVRTVVKNLRTMLRKAGMDELADAIDGSVYGHYELKLAL